MTIAEALAALVAELLDNDIPHPLAASFTLATVAADLCRLAGEPVPPAVAAVLDGPACHRLPVAKVVRWMPIADWSPTSRAH